MNFFARRDRRLYAEEVALESIADEYGTPCYVYSRAALEDQWRGFDQAFGSGPHLVCFAVKASSNLAVLNVLARLGSGFDIVSVGELERVVAAGGDPGRVVFSGVGKRRDELERALELGIRCFNVESVPELRLLEEVASTVGARAPVSLRVNPDVDARTHPYIATGLRENKFGIEIETALELYRRAAALPHIRVEGIDCHIGSQLTQLAPFLDALDRILRLVDELADAGIPLRHLDLGGGLGIRYTSEEPPDPSAYVSAVLERLGDREVEVLIEPGRAIAGNAGVLLTRVQLLKNTMERDFAVVDAAMNDLLRPALYQAVQDIVPVLEHADGRPARYDVVGPVCETGDFLGKGRELRLSPGELLAVRSSGAYGFSMSSNYNTRPRAAEVMVDGDRSYLVRRRETVAELFSGESLLP